MNIQVVAHAVPSSQAGSTCSILPVFHAEESSAGYRYTNLIAYRCVSVNGMVKGHPIATKTAQEPRIKRSPYT
jgi:hypothetical protein